MSAWAHRTRLRARTAPPSEVVDGEAVDELEDGEKPPWLLLVLPEKTTAEWEFPSSSYSLSSITN